MRPCESRNATSSSPSSLTRTGGQSGSGSSHARSAGIQYRRIASPMGVPRPTRVTLSFSSRASMLRPSLPYQSSRISRISSRRGQVSQSYIFGFTGGRDTGAECEAPITLDETCRYIGRHRAQAADLTLIPPAPPPGCERLDIVRRRRRSSRGCSAFGQLVAAPESAWASSAQCLPSARRRSLDWPRPSVKHGLETSVRLLAVFRDIHPELLRGGRDPQADQRSSDEGRGQRADDGEP